MKSQAEMYRKTKTMRQMTNETSPKTNTGAKIGFYNLGLTSQANIHVNVTTSQTQQTYKTAFSGEHTAYQLSRDPKRE